jgi:uncharacterized protein DUF4258
MANLLEPSMIRYDEHAEFQLERRRISKEWVEETVRNPEATESSGTRQSFLRCLPDRKFMLRVVTPLNDSGYVITAYFDRKRPCA